MKLEKPLLTTPDAPLLRLYTGLFLWNQSIVRFWLMIPAIVLLVSYACAQETEARIQKIMNPDRNSTSYLQDKSFYGGKSFQQTGQAYTKDFHYTGHYAPKDYSTRSWFGASSYSATGKFKTGEANTKGNYEIPNTTKKVGSKTAGTKESSYSGKSFAIHDYETREYRAKGKSQAILDQEKKDQKAMSVDQVRELLNKNK